MPVAKQTKAATKASSAKKTVKEKVFHPQSRKAGQLERKLLRKSKLENASSVRSKHKAEQVDRFVFFLHALPPEVTAISLPELHEIVRDVWLKRFDASIEAEQAARRKGRPKSTKEDKLVEQRLKDAEEYRAGLEVPDLTWAPNVALFRQWKSDDTGFLAALRFIRISYEHPDVAIVSRTGEQKALVHAAAAAGVPMDAAPSGDIIADMLNVSSLSVDPFGAALSSSMLGDGLSDALDDLL